jgi:hypothetical protein
MTNRTCHVTAANTPRLLYAFKLAPAANINPNGTSRSTILKSEDTCIKKFPSSSINRKYPNVK